MLLFYGYFLPSIVSDDTACVRARAVRSTLKTAPSLTALCTMKASIVASILARSFWKTLCASATSADECAFCAMGAARENMRGRGQGDVVECGEQVREHGIDVAGRHRSGGRLLDDDKATDESLSRHTDFDLRVGCGVAFSRLLLLELRHYRWLARFALTVSTVCARGPVPVLPAAVFHTFLDVPLDSSKSILNCLQISLHSTPAWLASESAPISTVGAETTMSFFKSLFGDDDQNSFVRPDYSKCASFASDWHAALFAP